MNGSKTKSWLLIFVLIVGVMLILYLSDSNKGGEKVSLTGENSVQYLIENGDVSDINISNGVGKIRIIGSEIASKDFPDQYDYYFTYSLTADIQQVYNWVEEYNNGVKQTGTGSQINTESVAASASWIDTILPWLSIVAVLVFGFILIKSITNANSKSMNFGKTKARMAQNIKIRFTDVAGVDEEKEELEEVVEFLKNPQKFTDLGAKIPKGILLVGPPGTGKTLLAKAIAGESNVPFFSISGSDFVEMFVGVGASRVRDLFDQAKKHAPCIIFIDEIDAVGRHRGAGLGGGNDEREQTLNQLLVQMDGFEGNEGVIVMAATNRSDILDPALLRPGRFDRQIHVYPPDVRGREMILKVHAKNKPMDSAVDFKTLARLTSGFTGADIESLLNEAAILAAKANRKKITMVDVTEGINKVLMGPQKKSRIITENDKKITAFHEAGHAILGKKLKNCDEVQEVSIIPRGMAAGYTLSRPDNDESHLSYNKLIDIITMMFGGRVAEELEVKDISTGASNDIQRATEIARKMVTEWGMSDLGAISFGSSQEIFVGKNYQTQINYSEKKAGEIDEEISKILKKCYINAKKILTENVKYMRVMVEILLEKETIYKDEVDMIMEGKSKESIIKIMDEREQKTKARVEFERAEADYEKAQKDQAVRIKTAEALKSAGVINDDEIIKIKTEAEHIVGTAKLKYEELKAKAEQAEKETEAKVAEEKANKPKQIKAVKEKTSINEESEVKKKTASKTVKKENKEQVKQDQTSDKNDQDE